jgi:hypothetical protein
MVAAPFHGIYGDFLVTLEYAMLVLFLPATAGIFFAITCLLRHIRVRLVLPAVNPGNFPVLIAEEIQAAQIEVHGGGTVPCSP